MILCLSWFGLDGGEVRQIAEHPYRLLNLTGNAVGSNIRKSQEILKLASGRCAIGDAITRLCCLQRKMIF